MKILIVDDNKDNIRLLEIMLKGSSYNVVSATDGIEALEKLRADGFDIIVSDILMPGMDGFQLCRECKENEELKHIPFVFYTAAYTDEKDEAFALSLGGDRFVRKPMEPDEFMEIIQGVVRDAERGKITNKKPLLEEEKEVFKLYSERLVTKLERKILTLAEEITKRKRAEEALRESEKKYRLLAENVTDVIFVQDMNFNMTYVSPSVTPLSGYSVEEALNQKMKDFMTPDSFAKAMGSFQKSAALAKTKKDIEIPPMEYEYIRKDGSTFWGEIRVTFLRDLEGRAVSVQGVLRDISERKRAEEEMRVKDNAIASSINGIAIVDLEGNLTYANHSFLEMWGYHDEKDVVGRNVVEFWQAEEDAAKVMKVATKRGGWIGELLAKRKDGSAFDVHAAASVVRDPGGKRVYRLASFVDITERKRAEEALRTTLNGTIQAIGRTTETRDPYTAAHQRRVTQLACAIAKEMNLPQDQIDGIRVAGLMHDIGKMSIPAEILAKPSKLSEIEFDLIKAHPQVAYDILKSIDFPWPVAGIILQHHERLDGSGYPKGVKDGDILLEARILGIADVVEAMSSHRPYRPALGIDKALKEIEKNKGTLYDPTATAACLRLFSEGRFEFDT